LLPLPAMIVPWNRWSIIVFLLLAFHLFDQIGQLFNL
jgi:hypothetical protein